MGQAKFSFRERQENFITRYKLYGYKDKSALVGQHSIFYKQLWKMKNLKSLLSYMLKPIAKTKILKN